MSDGNAILLTIAGTAIGSAASWFISRRYYLRSGTDLDAALRLVADRQGVNALARMFKQAGIGKANYDAAGNLTGIVMEASAHDRLLLTDSATATVIQGVPPQYDRQYEQPEIEKRDSPDA